MTPPARARRRTGHARQLAGALEAVRQDSHAVWRDRPAIARLECCQEISEHKISGVLQ
jgi:hypothetical protein